MQQHIDQGVEAVGSLMLGAVACGPHNDLGGAVEASRRECAVDRIANPLDVFDGGQVMGPDEA